MRSETFVVHASDLVYPTTPPFHPSERYPELEYLGDRLVLGPANATYGALRGLLAGYGLDRARFGTPQWNPFSTLAPAGGTIVIKPNLVLHEVGTLVGQRCLCTDGSVIRAVIDYAAKAVGSTGKIVVADVPLQGADFDALTRQLGLDAIVQHAREQGFDVRVLDLRREWAVLSADGTQVLERRTLPGDPRGYTTVDLGAESFLEPLARDGARFGITDYDEDVTNRHHRPGHHEYMLANTVLDADAVINLPKLKTHQKAGITAAMKNFVGINGSKDYLAHHRVGAPSKGGDEFPMQTMFNVAFREVRRLLNERAPHWVWRSARRIGLAMRAQLGRGTQLNTYGIGAGGWYGNETLWRTIYDINRAFFFYDRTTKRLADRPQRKYLAIVDAIVAGEGDGPLRPTPAPVHALVVGESPMSVDLVCARLLGLAPEKIPFLRERARMPELPADAGDVSALVHARPPSGWRGHVEL